MNYLRQLLVDKEKVHLMRSIFNKILDNYRLAKMEMYGGVT